MISKWHATLPLTSAVCMYALSKQGKRAGHITPVQTLWSGQQLQRDIMSHSRDSVPICAADGCHITSLIHACENLSGLSEGSV